MLFHHDDTDKGRNFEGFSVAQIKNCLNNESLDITWEYSQEIASPKDIQRIYMIFYGAAPKTVSGQQHPQILPHSN
jgi:hypothetical protein